MFLAVDGPSEEESGQLEVVIRDPVCLLQENSCYLIGIGKVSDDFELGDGKALDIKLEH